LMTVLRDERSGQGKLIGAAKRGPPRNNQAPRPKIAFQPRKTARVFAKLRVERGCSQPCRRAQPQSNPNVVIPDCDRNEHGAPEKYSAHKGMRVSYGHSSGNRSAIDRYGWPPSYPRGFLTSGSSVWEPRGADKRRYRGLACGRPWEEDTV
jgi:hypothetical protein